MNDVKLFNKEEIEKYKAIRDADVPIKTIKISNDADKIQANMNEASAKYEAVIDRPIHDTGSIWYNVLAFFLPILGLIGAFIFRHFNYLRNYGCLKRGAIAGLIFRAAIIVLFCIALLFAII